MLSQIKHFIKKQQKKWKLTLFIREVDDIQQKVNFN